MSMRLALYFGLVPSHFVGNSNEIGLLFSDTLQYRILMYREHLTTRLIATAALCTERGKSLHLGNGHSGCF